VILGNGASGFKTVTGHGTSGQFLTSNGAGSAPTWQTSAIDLAGNYAWTGNHNFAGTLTLVKNLIASTTITFSNGGAGLSYVFPTTRQASSTVLTEDGTGNLRFITPQVYVLRSQTNLNSGTSATATTSLATIRIPANTLGSVGTVFVKAFWELTNGDSCGLQMDIGSGSATTSAAQVGTGNTGYQFHTFDSTIMATSSNGVITSTIFAPLNVGGALNQTARIQGSPVNVPVTADSYISLAARSTGGGNTCTLSGYSVRVERF
jgi:hypothetical protein